MGTISSFYTNKQAEAQRDSIIIHGHVAGWKQS